MRKMKEKEKEWKIKQEKIESLKKKPQWNIQFYKE